MAGKLTQQDFGIPEVRQGMQDLTSDINKSINSIKSLVSESSKLSKGGIAKSSKAAADNLNKAAKATDNLTKEQKELVASMGELEKLRKQSIKTQGKSNVSETQTAKNLMRSKIALQEKTSAQRRSIKEEIQLKQAVMQSSIALRSNAKTIAQAEKQNKFLRIAVRHVDETTEKGRRTIEKYNTAIDRN